MGFDLNIVSTFVRKNPMFEQKLNTSGTRMMRHQSGFGTTDDKGDPIIASVMLTITQLGEDVLVQVLSLCDIASVLQISEVNRSLHNVTTVKQLWLRQIRNLQALSLIELPPGLSLHNHTTAELIEVVKSILAGPSTLTHGSSPPTVAKEILLHPSVKPKLHFFARVKFALGGRYVLIVQDTVFEIQDIFTTQRIWTREVEGEAQSCALDVLGGEDLATVALIYRINSGHQIVEFLRVDLRTGEAESCATIPIQMYTVHWNPIVMGELSIIPLSQAILLVNWLNSTAIILGVPKCNGRPGVGFAGGHIILNIRDTRILKRECVAIYCVAVFSEHWKSIDQLDFQNHASITEFPRTIVAYPTTEGHFFSEIQWSQMSVHASPLRRNAYQITLYLWDYTRVPSSIDSSGRGAVFRYMFTPQKSPQGKFQLKLTSTFRLRSGIQYHGFTYSGHAIEGFGHKCDVHDSPLRVSLEGGLSHPLPFGHLSLPGAPESITRDISPHSCVLATLMTSGLRISYFS